MLSRSLRYARMLHIGRRTFTFSRSLTPDRWLDGIKDKIRTSFGYYPCKRRRLMWKHLLRFWRSIKRTVHLQSDLSCSRRPNLRDSDLSAHKRIFLSKLRLLWLIFWRKFLSLKVKNFYRSHNNAKLISAFAFLPTIISQTLRRFAKIRWRISWETGLSRAKTCSCWCNISLNVVLQRCYVAACSTFGNTLQCEFIDVSRNSPIIYIISVIMMQ